MHREDARDFWDPENYPWEVGEDSPIAEWTHQDGYDDQWELIAQHVADGGEVDTAPFPSLRKYAAFIHRPTVEGIRQARIDAALLIGSGTYDPPLVLKEFAKRHREEESRDAEIKPGEFKRPDDWDSARIHTTVTRLFTDPVVFTVYGERYQPRHLTSFLMPFHGRLHLVGHADIDTGIDLDGEYKVDFVDSGRGGPGGLPGALRLLWGSEASVVGAIPCGWVRGRASCSGVGPANASGEIRQIAGELPVTGGIARLTTESGTSVWFPDADGDGFFEVFLAVDEDRAPVGIILDTSAVTQFWWWDDALDEGFATDWPPDAREFDPEIDEEGTNPNVTLTPPPEKEELSVEKLLADDAAIEEFTGEPTEMDELGLAHGEAAGYTRKRVETRWLLTTADGEHRSVIADTATEALDRFTEILARYKENSPDYIVVNIKKQHSRWVWDI